MWVFELILSEQIQNRSYGICLCFRLAAGIEKFILLSIFTYLSRSCENFRIAENTDFQIEKYRLRLFLFLIIAKKVLFYSINIQGKYLRCRNQEKYLYRSNILFLLP
jgi:hypothetical protein